MRQATLRPALAVLCAVISAGCSQIPNIDESLPQAADVLHIGRLHSVSWLSRAEFLISRHQWDAMPIAIGRSDVAARRAGHPVHLDLVVGGAGVGYEHDWVLVRATPAQEEFKARPIIDLSVAPKLGDLVVIFTRFPDRTKESSTGWRMAFGQLRHIRMSPRNIDMYPAGGDLFDVCLQKGRFVPGWSGSPAFLWDDARSRWVFLGIAVVGDSESGSDMNLLPQGRKATIARPPDWVFDLITSDGPDVHAEIGGS